MSVENTDPTPVARPKDDQSRAAELLAKQKSKRKTAQKKKEDAQHKGDTQFILCLKCNEPGLFIEADRVEGGWVRSGLIKFNQWFSKEKALDMPYPGSHIRCQNCRQTLTVKTDGVGNLEFVGTHNKALSSLKQQERQAKSAAEGIAAVERKRHEVADV